MSQSFNPRAGLYFLWVSLVRRSLMIPHFSVKDISKIDPEKLKYYGFKGLIFDKDNTLTAPYVNEIYPSIQDAFSRFQSLYGDNIVIMSNSAGTKDDKDYEDARKIEADLGIKVLIHDKKKPGGIVEVRECFDCSLAELVMFGDRIFTDIVFGNRYGMLTVHTALLTEEGDNQFAAKIRRYETKLIRKLRRKRKTPPHHGGYHKDICLESLV